MSLHQPQMLKDFLADDSNSCSSSGFRSFPRKPGEPTVRNLLDLINTNRKAASTTTISAIHKASEIVFNAVKYLSLSYVKSPLVLPRTISRKLSKRGSWNNRRRNDDVQEVSVTVVKVKDILRWKSFRDLIEEKPPPLNFSSSPQRCTTTTTTTESTTCSTSSWCDSDFTAEDLPSWRSYYDEDSQTGVSKKCLPEEGVGGDSTTVNTKGELSFEENEQQHSPVSVLNFPFQEDEEDYGDHDEYVEEEGHGLEENARRLMNHLKATSSSESCEAHVDQLLLDFFMCKLESRNQRNDDDETDCEMLRVAKDWMSGQYDESFKWEEESNKEVYFRDTERGVRWSKFEEEQEALAMEMEAGLLNYLVDELLLDLSCSSKTE